jgi:3-phosphoshikimate 1-carboxyvinyltransferase
VPGSKSLTQRSLIVAALARGESELVGALDCDDSRALREGLRRLGAEIVEAGESWRVSGGSLRPAPWPLWCGDGGTTLRFLAALSLVLPGGGGGGGGGGMKHSLDGSARLRERPHGPLLDALASLGVRSTAGESSAFLELERVAEPGSAVTVDAGESSQFASALLMVAPLLPGGLALSFAEPAADFDAVRPRVVSRPYLDMTVETMSAFGVEVERTSRAWTVAPGEYSPGRHAIEGDWSSAAFLLAAGRIAGRPVALENVRDDSAQGDRAIVALLAALGDDRPRRLDLVDCPDLLPPVAAVAACAAGPTEIVGVAHARAKESDRVAVLARGLRLAGAQVDERRDGLAIVPGAPRGPARLDPAGDHRMAMAFGLLSLRFPELEVTGRECVSKSFPDFWGVLDRFR